MAVKATKTQKSQKLKKKIKKHVLSSYSGRPGLSSSKYVALNSNSACSFPLEMEPLSRDFQIIENWYSAGSQQRKEGLYPVPRSVWAHLQIRFKGRDTSSWPDVTQQALDQRGVRAALTLYLLPSVLLPGRPPSWSGVSDAVGPLASRDLPPLDSSSL